MSDSTLEQYFSRRLSSYRAERIEEHLLACRECQDRVQAEIEFTAAMTTAAAKIGKGDLDIIERTQQS